MMRDAPRVSSWCEFSGNAARHGPVTQDIDTYILGQAGSQPGVSMKILKAAPLRPHVQLRRHVRWRSSEAVSGRERPAPGA